MTDRKKTGDGTNQGAGTSGQSGVRGRVADTTRAVATTVRRALPEMSPADMGTLLRKRNLQFALGAAIVVLLIALLRFTGGQEPPATAPAGAPKPAAAPVAVVAPKQPEVDTPDIVPRLPGESSPVPSALAAPGLGREAVEADVSTRSVAITSNFSGTEIVVFGAVDGSRQSSSEAGLYDVVVILEGTHTPIISRKKSHVAGIWLNTQSVRFASLPSYYTISATRPLEEIAEPAVLNQHGIGFEHVRMTPAGGAASHGLTPDEIKSHREAIIRLKQQDGLYIRKDYGTVFIGRSLFRTQIALPANVPVGPLAARVYLFSEGRMLSSFDTKVTLEREGIEAFLHTFAFEYALWYGIFCVFIAVIAGLAASAMFKKSAH